MLEQVWDRSLSVPNPNPNPNPNQVWDRSLSVPSGGEPTASSCAALRATLQSLGVSRVIIGHTPQA